jgi:hypothetical protein
MNVIVQLFIFHNSSFILSLEKKSLPKSSAGRVSESKYEEWRGSARREGASTFAGL